MKCETLREILPLLASGLLSSPESRAEREHLASCRDCSNALADLGRIHQSLSVTQSASVDPGFVRSVVAKLGSPPPVGQPAARFDIFDRVAAVGLGLLSLGLLSKSLVPGINLPDFSIPEPSSTITVIGLSLLAGFAIWQMGGALADLGANGKARPSR